MNVTVNFKGFYAPYEQDLVTETIFYFCPKQQYINNISHWANLKPPDKLTCDHASLRFFRGGKERN